MKIDCLDYHKKSHILSWFLPEAIVGVGIEHFGNFDSSNLDVVLTINGIDIPVDEIFNKLEDSINKTVKEKQQEAYKAGADDAFESVATSLKKLFTNDNDYAGGYFTPYD